ncbi:MAG: hypothetical protein JWM90_1939 [Thermoleophilia bacterium]|nr:hypothetical protein [Thermoleophilia bacterium]
MTDPHEPKRDGDDDDVEQGRGYSMPPSEPAGPAADDEAELEQGIGYSAPAEDTPPRGA